MKIKGRMNTVFGPLFLLICFIPTLVFAAPKPGSQAPDFKLPDLFKSHVEYSLNDMAGKVVLVDFWASWCAPCRATLPELGLLPSRNPGLVVLALSVDEDKSRAKAFLKTRDTSLIFLHDANRATAKEFDLGGMPSAYLIDRRGILRSRFDGYSKTDFKKIELEIKKLLEEKP